MRLSELATTRLSGFRRELVDGEEAWSLDIIGKGSKLRTVTAFDEVRTLLEQHHEDMDAAGVGFDARVERLQAPNSLPTTAAGDRMAGSGQGLDGTVGEAGGRHCRTYCKRNTGTLGGLSWGSSSALPRAVVRTGLGVPFLEHQQPSQADRYDAQERSALYKVLIASFESSPSRRRRAKEHLARPTS